MFFIRNCNGQIVGNPKGYKTHKGAQAQCEKQGKIRSAIYTAYATAPKNDNAQTQLVYSIKWQDMPKSEAAQVFEAAFNNPVDFLKKHFTIIKIQ